MQIFWHFGEALAGLPFQSTKLASQIMALQVTAPPSRMVWFEEEDPKFPQLHGYVVPCTYNVHIPLNSPSAIVVKPCSRPNLALGRFCTVHAALLSDYVMSRNVSSIYTAITKISRRGGRADCYAVCYAKDNDCWSRGLHILGAVSGCEKVITATL